MADTPKVFWIFAGVGVLILSAAFAYRIVTPNSDASINIGDVKVSVDSAQKGLDSAQTALQTVTQQAETEHTQIVALTSELQQAHQQIAQLVAEIQHAPNVASGTKLAAAQVLQEQAAHPLPTVEPINIAALRNAQTLLKQAQTSVTAARDRLAVTH